MALFPISIGPDTFGDLDALVANLDERARHNQLDHPGQYHPADYFTGPMGADSTGSTRQAIWSACARLLESSSEPQVMLMVAILCSGCQDPSVFRVLLARLEGSSPSIPRAPGLQQPSLRDEFIRILIRPYPAHEPSLHPRIVALLEHEGRWEEIVEFLMYSDPDRELLAAVRNATARGTLDFFVVSTLGATVARIYGKSLVDFAQALGGHPREHREVFLAEANKTTPNLTATLESDLRRALRL